MIWSLGILKVRLPPEIALQDFSDEFSPQSSPSPPPRHTFQRTQPRPSIHHTPLKKEHPLDLSTLGISDRPLAPFRNESTMDWIPSTEQTTFSPSSHPMYSATDSIFAKGKGQLPPAPGITFTPTPKPQQVNWFKSSLSPTLQKEESSDDDRRPNKDIQFREQRLFAPQVRTPLRVCRFNGRNQRD